MDSIVLLISEQSIHNILFLKQFEHLINHVLIFSTKEMEGKKKSNDVTAFISNKICYEIIEIDANDFYKINEKLEEMSLSSDDHYWVNITGGTKVASLAMYQFFSRFNNSRIFYSPLITNMCYQLYPIKKENNQIGYDYRLSVEEYLHAYGINVNSFKKPLSSFNSAINFYKLYHDKQLSAYIPILRALRKKFSHDKICIDYHHWKEIFTKKKSLQLICKEYDQNPEILFEWLNSLLEKFCDTYNYEINYKWIEYLTGGWFEEYIYHAISLLEIDDIQMSLMIQNSLVKQEFDIACTINNQFYYFECKTSLKSKETNIANETLYKQDSLGNMMGLAKYKFLLTLDRDVNDKETIVSRAKQNSITIADADRLSPEKIVGYLSDLLNITRRNNE